MANLSSNPTAVSRQRTFAGKPVDVEKATASSPGSNSAEGRSHHRLTLNSGPISELEELEAGLIRFRDRFTRKGKPKVGVVATFRAIAFSSWLNLFVVFIPLAWFAHFYPKTFPHSLTFTFCFLALVPLEWLFDWGGEQLALYLGTQAGDLVVITLNNVVEATLSIILLSKCELKLLQATVVGVVILHLLLIPGAAFITGGAMIMHQDLHPHLVQLNHTLLMVGVLSLLLPAAFFAALDHGVGRQLTPEVSVGAMVNDETRHIFLVISRGLAIILLILYICSRIFLHNPPGEENDFRLHAEAPAAMREEEKDLIAATPKANQWVLIVVLLISIGIMAATTEWLVESVEFVRESGNIEEEWFGMFLLPIVSWAANGFVAIVYFLRYLFKHFFKEPAPPQELAKARAIDLSIQFTLFWMPFLVMLGWWSGKPMSLLFDFFEIAVLLGACFVVNYVTADAKTNWAEGFAMVSFYCMIGVCAWFYSGQPEIRFLLGIDRELKLSHCGSVAQALAAFVNATEGGGTAHE
ncbi:putative Ca(2) cation antiporter (CaCA) (TC 2.A.19) family protein [Lyophyllum shimeji]|uniref:Ca(2) cation antiporter (CaCA) (TC 2.A.19) family protein n=1 Tax=Lyophyllum shimeji TaxID=47721 RepID=A0A9P3PD76_LYOSH|nr:putative Ca(2) cation antiporter (CaCA) (TC 2.A.19) family protein [Lyophyllum shimeji]